MAVLALAIGAAWAEGAPAAGGPEKVAKGERGQHPLFGRLAEKLGLSDKQKEDAKAILKAAHEANRKNLKDAFEKVKTTVLTDAQRAKLKDRREGWREGPGRKGGKGKGGEGKGAGPAPAPAATPGK